MVLVSLGVSTSTASQLVQIVNVWHMCSGVTFHLLTHSCSVLLVISDMSWYISECLLTTHMCFISQVIYTSTCTACVVCCGRQTISDLSVSYFIIVYLASDNHSHFHVTVIQILYGNMVAQTMGHIWPINTF